MSRLRAAALVATASLAIAVPPAAAGSTLSVRDARERASEFAASTCDHDQSCVDSGVLNCRRQGRNIVFCRIFDRRDTEVQGRFVCNRLVRLARRPPSRRVQVTGLGRWHC
ncbi:MAG: hypothetical protein ACM3NV_03665 [Syntrophothermus sp.]